MILVDSTKYISWMRRGQSPIVLLAPLLKAGSLVSCGIIRLEVLRGVIKPKPKAELTDFFDLLPDIPLAPALLREAADLAWKLDRKGSVLPATDLIIAACALHQGAEVVSEDPHFRHVPGLQVRAEL